MRDPGAASKTHGWPVVRWGEAAAPTVLLVHGFLGHGGDWAALAARLPGTCSLAPTLPGHAGTPLVEPVSLDGLADGLAATLDAAGVTRADVVGYSLGGRVSLRFALRHPSRVRRLALVSTSPGLDAAHERAARLRIDHERASRIRADFDGFLRDWYAAPMFALDASPGAVGAAVERRSGALSAVGRPMDAETAARLIVALSPGAQPSSWGRLAELNAPTLWVVGARDERYLGLSAAAVSRLQHAERVAERAVIPGVGHAVHLDASAALAERLTSFFGLPTVAPTGAR